MADYMTYYDSDYLGAWDLADRDVTLKIVAVSGGEITGDAGRKSRKLLIQFGGKRADGSAMKPMVCNKTNAKTIASLYGRETERWIGQRVTLYATVTEMAGESKPCIRVRPVAPPAAAEKSA